MKIRKDTTNNFKSIEQTGKEIIKGNISKSQNRSFEILRIKVTEKKEKSYRIYGA